MTRKHSVRISLADAGNGEGEPLLESRQGLIRERLARLLFGGYSEVLVLKPGRVVDKVIIEELNISTLESHLFIA